MSRRKLKTERELVADIRKCFSKFCGQLECRDCPLYGETTTIQECIMEYMRMLLVNNPDNSDK